MGVSGSYELIELHDLHNIRQTIALRCLRGFNVTIPYKKAIIPLLDETDSAAASIGAVNTVKVSMDGDKLRLTGFNTDATAFIETLKPLLLPHHNKALILGTGGAALAVAFALRQLGVDYLFVSRTPEVHSDAIGYDAIIKEKKYSIIINATPIGMFPDVYSSPWPLPEILGPQHLCYDLVYNPSPTRFLSEAKQRGATVIDGLPMLYLQADKAFDIWCDSQKVKESNS